MPSSNNPVSEADTYTAIGDDRRQQLIQTAHDLIAEKGFEGLRVREVAARVGLNNATLHYYFPTKEDLVRAVVEAIVRELDRVPAPGSAPDALSPREALHAHFHHVLQQTIEHPDRFVVLNELFLRAARDEEVRRILAATDTSWHGYLVPLLKTGIEQGAFHADLDPYVAAAVITSFFKGLGLQLTLPPEHLRASVEQLERWIAGE